MAEFLSLAWIEELDRALQTLPPPASGAAGDLVIEQRVALPTGEIHRHHLVVAGGRVRARAGAAADADLVLTTDFETAVAIQRGVVNAQLALAAGHLRLGGNLDRLLARSEVFAGLDDVFGDLRTSTTYGTFLPDRPDHRSPGGPPLASPS